MTPGSVDDPHEDPRAEAARPVPGFVPAASAPWPVSAPARGEAGPGHPSGNVSEVGPGAGSAGAPSLSRAQLRAAQARAGSTSATRRFWFLLGGLAVLGLAVFAVVIRGRAEPGSGPLAGPAPPATSVGLTGVGAAGRAEDLARLATVQVTDTSPGQAPTVAVPQRPLRVASTARRTLRAGSGRTAVAGGTVRVAGVTVRGSDGSVVETSYGDPQLVTLTPQATLAGLVGALTGVQPGARVVIAVPPAEAFGAQGNPQLAVAADERLVFVFDVLDVLPGRAEGVAVAPTSGLPTVTVVGSGPAVQVPAGAPPGTLVTQPLIEGLGAQIRAGQDVVVHYTAVLWKDGSVVDSTWPTLRPFLVSGIGQADVIPAWNKTLVGARVGSRLLLVVPPADGYGPVGSPPAISGTDTLVFVVDILAAY